MPLMEFSKTHEYYLLVGTSDCYILCVGTTEWQDVFENELGEIL